MLRELLCLQEMRQFVEEMRNAHMGDGTKNGV